MQFICIKNDQFMFSDGVASIAAGVGNYNSIFNSIPADTCERVSTFNQHFRNLRIAPKHSQATKRIGNPAPL